MEHVLEHLVTTAVAEAIPEENVMVQRLLVSMLVQETLWSYVTFTYQF